MSLLVPGRRPARELLDSEALPSEEMTRSLRDIAVVNRWWGGSRALARHLSERIRGTGRDRVRLLDVGAGSGDVSRRLARQLRRAGCEATVMATDLKWRHLAAGRRIWAHRLPSAAADAFQLPFADAAFDWAVSTLLFHHFSPDANVSLLREVARVARDGFALLDLRRHRLPLLFVSVAGRLFFDSRVSLEDGMTSVRQAYTPAEAREIAQRGVEGSRVERVFPFRMLICGPGA